MRESNSLSKLSLISLILFLIHAAMNLLIPEPINFLAVVLLHLFFSLSIFLTVFYMKRGKQKDANQIWVSYVFTILMKFGFFLNFIFAIKYYFEVSKAQALLHIFVWFFIYFYIEVKMILEVVKTVKKP